MSILFVLVIFLLCISASYYRDYRRAGRAVQLEAAVTAARAAPVIERRDGFAAPLGVCFHPGHTWVLDEGRHNARVGLDGLAATLLGKVERIEVTPLNRWVRQGQRIWTLHTAEDAVEMMSPIEGMVIDANPRVLRDPNLALDDPYGDGWILVLQVPQMSTSLKNLIPDSLVRPWLQDCLDRFAALSRPAMATGLDAGPPVRGALAQLEPGLRRRAVKELFLT
jgi:glycine cleavage system H protein